MCGNVYGRILMCMDLDQIMCSKHCNRKMSSKHPIVAKNILDHPTVVALLPSSLDSILIPVEGVCTQSIGVTAP